MLSEYAIGEVIGRGGFAIVYVAYHRQSHKRVALKIIDKRAFLMTQTPRHFSDNNVNNYGVEKEEVLWRERIRNEIEIHARITRENVPGIVRLMDYFEEEQVVVMVLEYCNGMNLFQWLKQRKERRVSEREAGYVMYQIVKTLEQLHKKGIIHRDLKLSNLIRHSPGNDDDEQSHWHGAIDTDMRSSQSNRYSNQVSSSSSSSSSSAPSTAIPLFSSNPSIGTMPDRINVCSGDALDNEDDSEQCSIDYCIKLCDFGLATQCTHPDDEQYTLCGTPNYLAPEVVWQQAYDVSVDIWAAGCLLYCMLVGHPPFESADANPQVALAQTLARIKQNDYVIPDGLSPTAVDLIKKMLCLDRRHRISAKTALSHRFFNSAKSHFETPVVLQPPRVLDSSFVTTSSHDSWAYQRRPREDKLVKQSIDRSLRDSIGSRSARSSISSWHDELMSLQSYLVETNDNSVITPPDYFANMHQHSYPRSSSAREPRLNRVVDQNSVDSSRNFVCESTKLADAVESKYVQKPAKGLYDTLAHQGQARGRLESSSVSRSPHEFVRSTSERGYGANPIDRWSRDGDSSLVRSSTMSRDSFLSSGSNKPINAESGSHCRSWISECIRLGSFQFTTARGYILIVVSGDFVALVPPDIEKGFRDKDNSGFEIVNYVMTVFAKQPAMVRVTLNNPRFYIEVCRIVLDDSHTQRNGFQRLSHQQEEILRDLIFKQNQIIDLSPQQLPQRNAAVSDRSYRVIAISSLSSLLVDSKPNSSIEMNRQTTPSVGNKIAVLYMRILKMIAAIRRRIPRTIVYFSCVQAKSGDRNDLGEPYARPSSKPSTLGECKCVIMSNGPLPDIVIQWASAARFSYAMSSGQCVLLYPVATGADKPVSKVPSTTISVPEHKESIQLPSHPIPSDSSCISSATSCEAVTWNTVSTSLSALIKDESEVMNEASQCNDESICNTQREKGPTSSKHAESKDQYTLRRWEGLWSEDSNICAARNIPKLARDYLQQAQFAVQQALREEKMHKLTHSASLFGTERGSIGNHREANQYSPLILCKSLST